MIEVLKETLNETTIIILLTKYYIQLVVAVHMFYNLI